LLEECRAMREEAEEPLFNPMMFGGVTGMGMGSYGNLGMGYPVGTGRGNMSYPANPPRSSYYTTQGPP
jgi:hypothetical protein